MKRVTGYKEVTIRVPASYEYSCDGCGYVFKKGERKVTQIGHEGKEYACYDKPCSPFSKPKGYVWVFDIEKQGYVWKELK